MRTIRWRRDARRGLLLFGYRRATRPGRSPSGRVADPAPSLEWYRRGHEPRCDPCCLRGARDGRRRAARRAHGSRPRLARSRTRVAVLAPGAFLTRARRGPWGSRIGDRVEDGERRARLPNRRDRASRAARRGCVLVDARRRGPARLRPGAEAAAGPDRRDARLRIRRCCPRRALTLDRRAAHRVAR